MEEQPRKCGCIKCGAKGSYRKNEKGIMECRICGTLLNLEVKK